MNLRITSLILTLIFGLGCTDEPVEESPVPAESGTEESVDERPVVETEFGERLALYKATDRAYLRRTGLVFGPGLPGWNLVSTVGGQGPWRPSARIEQRLGAWLDGIGATLSFPVSEDGRHIDRILIWLRPISRGQAVSLFLDGRPLQTLNLKPGWHAYEIPIKAGGLAAGEHQLRFWFRFLKPLGRLKTPAALSEVRLLARGESVSEGDADSTAPMSQRGEAKILEAGPPTGWSFFLALEPGSRLVATAENLSGEPVEFVVRVTSDVRGAVELIRSSMAAGQREELDIDLGDYAGTPVRLSLETTGDARRLDKARWVEPRIVAPVVTPSKLKPVTNVILWVIDGLRSDRPGLGRTGQRAATPNLDRLARNGMAAAAIWSGSDSPSEGHRRIIGRVDKETDLSTTLLTQGVTTGLFTLNHRLPFALARAFASRLDLKEAGEGGDVPALHREIDAWLHVRRNEPFLLYLKTDEPRASSSVGQGYMELYARQRALGERTKTAADAYDARLSELDYWIGQLVAMLARHDLSDKTAIVITGSVGRRLPGLQPRGNGFAGFTDLVHVPLVVWHPNGNSTGKGPLLKGGDLLDIGPTVLGLMGRKGADTMPGRNLLPHLSQNMSRVVRPSAGRINGRLVGRFGDWLLRSGGSGTTELFWLDGEGHGWARPTKKHPITIRGLRDILGLGQTP